MRYIKFILIALLVQACGSSVPLSEIYVFNHEPSTSEKDSLSFTRTGGLSVYPKDLNLSKYGLFIRTEKGGTLRSGITDLPFAINYSRALNFQEFAIGYNIGPGTLGLNTTFRIFGKNYFSVNAAAYNGIETVLQRPLTHSHFNFLNEGLHEFNTTFGLYSKAQYLVYSISRDDPYDGITTSNYHSDFTFHFGVRSFFQLRNISNNHQFVGFISTGYAPELDDFILNFGLTVGFIRF